MLELAKVETPCHTSKSQANPKPGENQQRLVDSYENFLLDNILPCPALTTLSLTTDKAQESKMMGKMKKPVHVSDPGASPRP